MYYVHRQLDDQQTQAEREIRNETKVTYVPESNFRIYDWNTRHKSTEPLSDKSVSLHVYHQTVSVFIA